MNTALKQLYRTQTKQRAFPYETTAEAKKRLWAIFRTGNVGRFKRRHFFTSPAGAAGMAAVWVILSPLVATPMLIPEKRDTFDLWVKQQAINIANAYSLQAPHPLGIAQKTLNLFLKDLWAWNKLTSDQEDCLHAPIDRIIYQKFRAPPKSWRSWTIVKHSTQAELNSLWADYHVLQDAMRARATLLSPPAQKIQPIMLEQILWGGI